MSSYTFCWWASAFLYFLPAAICLGFYAVQYVDQMVEHFEWAVVCEMHNDFSLSELKVSDFGYRWTLTRSVCAGQLMASITPVLNLLVAALWLSWFWPKLPRLFSIGVGGGPSKP